MFSVSVGLWDIIIMRITFQRFVVFQNDPNRFPDVHAYTSIFFYTNLSNMDMQRKQKRQKIIALHAKRFYWWTLQSFCSTNAMNKS